MEFPQKIAVRIEDTDAEPILDAVPNDIEAMADVFDNGARVAIYELVEVKNFVKECKLV